MSRSPLTQASYRLAWAFGWTPQEVQALTMAQISMFLHMLDEDAGE
jgi:hypothetical protein